MKQHIAEYRLAFRMVSEIGTMDRILVYTLLTNHFESTLNLLKK